MLLVLSFTNSQPNKHPVGSWIFKFDNIAVWKPLPLLSNVYKANNTTEALEVAHTFCKDIFFIGGEQIFKAGLQVADSVYLTYINKDFECDRFFDKDLLESNFDLIQSKKSEVNKELTFRIYYKNGA